MCKILKVHEDDIEADCSGRGVCLWESWGVGGGMDGFWRVGEERWGEVWEGVVEVLSKKCQCEAGETRRGANAETIVFT